MPEAPLAGFIDRFTVEYVRDYPHPIGRVWRAISDPAEFRAWFMPGEIELHEGGAFSFASGGWRGVVLAAEPPRLLRLRGTFGAGRPSTDKVGYFQYELSETAAGTRMRFVQHFDPHGVYGEPGDTRPGAGTPWPGSVNGWHEFWDALGDHLDGVPAGSRLPLTRLAQIATNWAKAADESGLGLTPRQLEGVVLGLRRWEHDFELCRLYDVHMLANLPPADPKG